MNTPRIAKTRFGTASFLIAAAFLLSPVLAGRLQPNAYFGGRSRHEGDRARRNSSSVGMMFGELRTAMSDIMFVKTERYLHSGVAYVPHMSEELLSVSGKIEAMDRHQAEVREEDAAGPHADPRPGNCADHDEGHDPACNGEHEMEVTDTVIRTEETDFRGFVGRLHRAVKPYRDPREGHGHTDGRELLPWFRVMTVSDPGYIPGYTTGAWWLKSRNPDEALAFAEEGVEKNPEAFQIHLVKGQILLALARDAGDIFHPDAPTRDLLDRARQAFVRSAELALAQRPDIGPEDELPQGWTTYMDADAFSAARMAALMESRYGDPVRGRAMARDSLQRLGDDVALRSVADGK